MQLVLQTESWPFRDPFRITDFVFTEAQVLVATLRDGDFSGRGEANGVYYHDETPKHMVDQIEAVRDRIEAGIDREALRGLLPPGGARNALDCALWDLEARRSGCPAWKSANVHQPVPLRTTFTIGADTPEHMAAVARGYAHARAIKLKLTHDDAAACVGAVRAARPDVWIGVDANQGFTRRSLEDVLPSLIEARVALIEQPLPRGEDGGLAGLRSPIPLAADESVQSLPDIEGLATYYDLINIKLDKCGGLTEGLLMEQEARRHGLRVMVGCMNGTSLAMAPAFVLAQRCDFVDLDAPTFLARERQLGAGYADGNIWCPEAVWGGAE
ncbi:MAG TPA: dipeptide epimerase [Rhodanobacteraceae bacterium]|nr:dipeptide epimerase [Rhodanobacteraceae bacterium]